MTTPNFLCGANPDVSRRVVQSTVLVEDPQVSAAHDLPGKAYLETRTYREDGLLSKGHCTLYCAMASKLAQIRGQEGSHVARRRIDLAGASPQSADQCQSE